jgi:hypothetical protein
MSKKQEYDWSQVLEGIGSVASIFNPAIGRGIFLASEVADRLLSENDEVFENNIVGLTRSAEILDDMIDTNTIDFARLKMVSKNLRSLETIVSKVQKIVR